MWNDIINWWLTLWVDQKPVATALAGFIAAFLLFLIKDYFWQKRFLRIQQRLALQQQQLDKLYSPLYSSFREAYSRFQSWKNANPDTELPLQPFFKTKEQEENLSRLFVENSGYASQTLLRFWTDYKAHDDDKEKRNELRKKVISTLIREYNLLRQQLKLDFDKTEIKTGEFK